jgi:EF hand
MSESTLTVWSMWRLLVLALTFFSISSASCLSQGTASQEDLSDTLEQRFDLLDTDADGVLTMEEVGRPRLFRRLDSDKDGRVTRAEAETLFESRRVRVDRLRFLGRSRHRKRLALTSLKI